jgi:hypothetical protein
MIVNPTIEESDVGKNLYELWNLTNYYYIGPGQSDIGLIKMPKDYVILEGDVGSANPSGVDFNQSLLPVQALIIIAAYSIFRGHIHSVIIFFLGLYIYTQMSPPLGIEPYSSLSALSTVSLASSDFVESEVPGVSSRLENDKEYISMLKDSKIPLHIHDYDVTARALTEGLLYSLNGIDWIRWPKDKVIFIRKRSLHAVKAEEDAELVTNTSGDILSKATFLQL